MISADQVATIEARIHAQEVQDSVDYVKEGIRTKTDLRRCGCARCVAALKILKEKRY